MKNAPFLVKSLICICMIFASGLLHAQTKYIPKGNPVACFDYFTYTGNDDYYKENALPDENSFYNPILPGWYSDPSICTNGKDYFLVTSTFIYYPGVPIFHSTDLVNWKQIGHVLDRPSQLKNFPGQGVSGGIFAPAISYNPHNETYYMITTNVGAGNFFVKTKDPFGSWSDPIYLPEVGGIDPSFFFDEDGRAYIVNNDGMDGKELYSGHRSIRVREFDVKADQTTGPWKMLVNGGVNLAEKPIWIEGPHMYKINGKYYLMAAEGGTGPNHSEVIFMGDSPMGEFKPWNKNPILTQKHLPRDRPNPITCAGHADLIQTKEGDWWAVFLACRPIDNKFENLGRETFMMPVRWSEDGFPYMTRGDEVIPMISRREGVKRNEKVTFGNFDWRDDFDSATLGMEWLTLRTPISDLYSLTENPGYLSLKSSPVSVSEKKAPAFLSRRMQHHKFESATRMYFKPTDEQDMAGVLLFKDEQHHIFFAIQGLGDKKEVKIEQNSKSGSNILAKKQISLFQDQAIELKVVSHGMYYDFYYNLGNNEWTLLHEGASARELSTANAGGFTGTTIGLYATRKTTENPETQLPAGFDIRKNDMAYGEVQSFSYYSKVAGTERKANIILPPNYTNKKKYPVLYLLHGIGGNENEWLDGKPNEIISNLTTTGQAKEMIVVIPNISVVKKGKTPALYMTAEHFAQFDNFLDEMKTNLLPYVEKNYSVLKGRENRAVAGLSMGGRSALHVGIHLIKDFAYIGAFTPAPGVLPYFAGDGLFTAETLTLPDAYRKNTWIMITKGTTDNVVRDNPENYSNTLKENGVDHTYLVLPGGHWWDVWNPSLYYFAKKIFQ